MDAGAQHIETTCQGQKGVEAETESRSPSCSLVPWKTLRPWR